MVRYPVEVVPESDGVDRGSASEELRGGLGPHEAVSAQWGQLTDRFAVASDDERLAFGERPHDPAAVVPQLPLVDLTSHPRERSTVCHIVR